MGPVLDWSANFAHSLHRCAVRDLSHIGWWLVALSLAAAEPGGGGYRAEIQKWREGYEADLKKAIAAAGSGIVAAPNFSTGMVLFEAMVAHAAKLMASNESRCAKRAWWARCLSRPAPVRTRWSLR